MEKLFPYFEQKFDVVYGYRSRLDSREETPFLTYFFIKLLSLMECLITGIYRKEWHSGFVMYGVQFLRSVSLSSLTTTPHIDGQLLFISGLFKSKVAAIPIFKKYKKLEAFEGAARRKYVLNVFSLMFKFRKSNKNDYLRIK